MTIGVIPARYQSTRLPGKPLADIEGKPMILRVYERAKAAACLDRVVIATDDRRVADAAVRAGADVMMTLPTHRSGADRVAEVAKRERGDIFVNIQGDEPLLDPRCIEQVVAPLLSPKETAGMSTLRTAFQDPGEASDPNVVKVVVRPDGSALYFSRASIPYRRTVAGAPPVWKHLGIYAYRRDFLLWFAAQPPTPLEQTEGLEQLRALEHGARILVPETEWDSHGVDTPEDLAAVRRQIQDRGL